MATKKDMRRPDLAIPYVEPKDEAGTDFGSTLTSTLPMAAMFTRNRILGWFAVLTTLLNWLGETPAQKRTSSSPGYLSFGMSVMAIGVTYLPLFLPPPPVRGTGTGAAPAVPA